MEIIIEQDKSCDMLSINTSDKICLFHGNVWDFNASGDTFKKLFEKLDIKVRVINSNLSQ